MSTDLFARTQAEFDRRQAEFLITEVATCSRRTDLTATMHARGNRRVAEQTLADAENTYATVMRSLSDRNLSRGLTIKARQEITKTMKVVRGTLDGLQRFSNCE